MVKFVLRLVMLGLAAYLGYSVTKCESSEDFQAAHAFVLRNAAEIPDARPWIRDNAAFVSGGIAFLVPFVVLVRRGRSVRNAFVETARNKVAPPDVEAEVARCLSETKESPAVRRAKDNVLRVQLTGELVSLKKKRTDLPVKVDLASTDVAWADKARDAASKEFDRTVVVCKASYAHLDAAKADLARADQEIAETEAALAALTKGKESV